MQTTHLKKRLLWQRFFRTAAVLVIAFAGSALYAANPANYHTALKDAQSKQQPLLVLIGANWCPGCQVMKMRVLPSLAQRGGLREVSFAHVDADTEIETAKQLMRGSTIPQLIVFSKKPDGGWHREQITGETSEKAVESLIARAVKAQQAGGEAVASAIGN